MLVLAVTACTGAAADAGVPRADVAEAPAPQPAGAWTDPGTRARELDEFRAGLPRPSALVGAPSANSLVRAWVRAVERRDTAAFAPMLLSRAEFAWLYYDTHPLSRPPYDLSPALMWFQQVGNSAKGLREVLEKRGGRTLGFMSFRCDPPIAYGDNRFHGNCVVEREEGGRRLRERLFGALVERDGRWKFVSYSARL